MSNEHMSEFDPSAPVSEQAEYWCIVFQGGNVTRADKKAFAEWVSRSPERVEAYLQVARLTTALKSKVHWPETPIEVLVREAAEEAPADIVPLFRTDASPARSSLLRRGRKRVPLAFAVAASLLVVLLGVWTFLAAPRSYVTAIGEQRSVVLNDGSVVTLNTSSNIEVQFAKNHRVIKLVAGEALFQVAHDKTRPFDVIAGNVTVRAVGTQFNVDRRASSTTVTVVEGKVSVANGPENTRSADAPVPIPVSAGEEVVVRPRVRPRAMPANVVIATAWTQRRLVFERRPLGEVAAEFNRYNRQKILIESEMLRNQEVTGMVQANDPSSLLDFVAKIPGVRIEQQADFIKVDAVD